MPEPSRVRNPISIIGAWLTTLGAFAFITYYVVEELGLLSSPYAGLFGFVAAPAVFLLGLLLIPIGVWHEVRRRHGGRGPWTWPTYDLSRSGTRAMLAGIAVLTIVNLAIVAVAGFGAAHYMETDEFCGQVCHAPMTPQFAAHEVAPHASVNCVQCHVSPGAAGTVRAKLNGTRQLALLITGDYERPIGSPARGLPVAADTCWQCHTPGFPDRDLTITRRAYASDEENTETVTTLEMLTSRIHWHARPDVVVEYVATDASRDTIPWVRVSAPDRPSAEFLAAGTTERPAGAIRRMDCLDCHSRPAHRFSASADVAVDRAMAAGDVSRTLPFAKRELVAALTADYATEGEALAGIGRHLQAFYQARPDVPPADIAQAIASAQRLYRLNVFPDMKVTWGTYVSQIGHSERSGCLRCHDDQHTAPDGRAVPMDCAACHRIQ
jgi:hypothetical protein